MKISFKLMLYFNQTIKDKIKFNRNVYSQENCLIKLK